MEETTETAYLTADDAKAMIDAALSPVLERLDSMREMIESGGTVEIEVEGSDDAVTDERAAEPATVVPATAQVDQVEAAIARSAAAIRKLGVDAISDEATALVKSRRLLPANVEAYIRRSLSGADVSDIVGDYSGAATMSGVAVTGDPASAPAVDAGPLTESAALARAKAELPTASVQAQIRRCYEIMDAASAAGRTVLAHH